MKSCLSVELCIDNWNDCIDDGSCHRCHPLSVLGAVTVRQLGERQALQCVDDLSEASVKVAQAIANPCPPGLELRSPLTCIFYFQPLQSEGESRLKPIS